MDLFRSKPLPKGHFLEQLASLKSENTALKSVNDILRGRLKYFESFKYTEVQFNKIRCMHGDTSSLQNLDKLEMRMLCSIHNLHVSNELGLAILPFIFTNNHKSIPAGFVDQNFEKIHGELRLDKIGRAGVIGYGTASFHRPLKDIDIGIEFDNLGSMYLDMIDRILSFLWFIKDCCCYVNELIGNFTPYGGIAGNVPHRYTNCLGKEEPVSFTNEEIKEASSLFLKFNKIVGALVFRY